MLLTTFLLLSCYAITIQGETHCNTCADIVLLIDESGSIDDTEFGLMIDFLKSLVNAFAANIGKTNGVQIGAACFSSINNQRDHFYLNQFDSAPAINSVLDSITPHGGGTYLGLALQYVRENMFGVSVGGGRPCAQRFVLVFTDGVSQDIPETEANLLKAQNVKIISVGIGNGIDQHQLQNIASSLDLVFIADFEGLQSIKQTIMNAVCQQENSGDMKGFCGFPCTLQNKTFDLCPCDPDNTNQTLSIQSLDPTVIAFIEGTETEEWQCFQRSGRFYVLRRHINVTHWEYLCLKDTMYNSPRDIRVFYLTKWKPFTTNPTICDVCDGTGFPLNHNGNYIPVVIKEIHVDCGIVIVPPLNCTIPTICPVPVNSSARQCDGCEPSEGNDDGLCCDEHH